MKEQKYTYKYPHPAVTTDCVIFGFDGRQLQVLLIERGIEPYQGCWALPGGFIRMNESADTGARRELLEETGLDHAFLEQFHTFSAPKRDPRERVITIAYYALVQISEVHGGDDAHDAKWFPIANIPNLAFDHDHILRVAMRKLRERIHFEPIGFELLGDTFTMKELQTLYESILGVHFDRRNFSKKMLHFNMIDLVEDTADTQPSSKREALRYRFNQQSYEELKRNGFQLEF